MEMDDSSDLDAEITDAVLAVLRRHIPAFVVGTEIEDLVLALRSGDVSAVQRDFNVSTVSPRDALDLLSRTAAGLLERVEAEDGRASNTGVDGSRTVDGRVSEWVDVDVDEEAVVGAVRVNTASLLLVDPGHLPAELVSRLLTERDCGRGAPGLLVSLLWDGESQVISTPDGIEVLDPYGDEAYPHPAITRQDWTHLVGPAAGGNGTPRR